MLLGKQVQYHNKYITRKHNLKNKSNINDINFKGAVSLASIRRAFAPHVTKTHNFSDNISLLKKFCANKLQNIKSPTMFV